ncbi:MAG: ABC transporter ATP-binding protein [Terriglobales bacterium]
MSSAQQEEEVLGKAYDGRLMKRLMRYVRGYLPQILLATGAALIGSVTQVAGPFLNKVVIDRYLDPTRSPGSHTFLFSWLPANAFVGIADVAVIYLILLAAGFGLDFVQTYAMQWVGQHSMFDLRRDLFNHLQRLQVEFFDRNPVGRLVTRVTNDVETINDMISNALVAFFDDTFVLLLIVIVMFRTNWLLALLALSVTPLIALGTAFFRRAVRDSYRRVRLAVARINTFLQEHLSGMSVVQSFNREERAFAEFRVINHHHRHAWTDAVFAYAVYYPVVEILSTFAIAMILWFGGLRVLDKTLTIGIVVMFIQYSQRFFRPIQDLSDKYNILQSAMAGSERIFKLLDTPVTLTSPATPAQVPAGVGRIEFDHVWFAYSGENWVLKDVSFAAEPGTTLAIVGHTGAGKTTLTSLLLRFYDIQRGRILVNGVDIREWDLTELRRRFAVVLQDPYLTSGTIADNIRMGQPDLSDAAVERALEQADLADFVRAQPEGLKTMLRERGAGLSTGQKQLVSFARALAPNPPYLILDEATASVDTETETKIRRALDTMVTGRTSIIIAHRLSTIQRADLILVLHKGVLREQGTHQALLRERGIYWRLYRLQYQGQARRAAAGTPVPAAQNAP